MLLLLQHHKVFVYQNLNEEHMHVKDNIHTQTAGLC